jgi:uncharacterized DUF497 family protein
MTKDYEWDDDKNASNLEKHGISFDEAIEIFGGAILSNGQFHEDSGEYRELSFGLLGGVVVLAVAHTDRDGKIRIISARKATKQERKLFYGYLEKTLG